jgi:hypothetical protein
MEAVRSSETSVNFYWTTQYCISAVLFIVTAVRTYRLDIVCFSGINIPYQMKHEGFQGVLRVWGFGGGGGIFMKP